MNAEDKDRILNRVRKMLRLANDAGATEGERDNALRMAHATLAKYNLDIAQAEESGQGGVDDRAATEAVFFGRPWARHVAGSSARLFFCSYLFIAAKRAKDTRHLFIGRQANAITASEMAKYLVASITREGRRYQGDESNDTFRAFCWGAAYAISRRVTQLIKDSEKQKVDPPIITNDRVILPKSGMDLVLASVYAKEEKANQLIVNRLCPSNPETGKRREGRSGLGVRDGDAIAAGTAFGSSISLNKQLEIRRKTCQKL